MKTGRKVIIMTVIRELENFDHRFSHLEKQLEGYEAKQEIWLRAPRVNIVPGDPVKRHIPVHAPIRDSYPCTI